MSDYPVNLGTITKRQGETLDIDFGWSEGGVPVDLTGWTALLQVRDSADAVLVALSSADGEITLGGSPFNVEAAFTAAHTLALPVGSYKSDVRLADAGDANVVYPVEFTLKIKKPTSRTA